VFEPPLVRFLSSIIEVELVDGLLNHIGWTFLPPWPPAMREPITENDFMESVSHFYIDYFRLSIQNPPKELSCVDGHG
jgi:hypothetical protein